MTMLEQFGRYIPDYYPTMYLDGYTPYEIMGAASRQTYDSSQKRGDKKLEKELQVALDAAMKDLFKDWK